MLTSFRRQPLRQPLTPLITPLRRHDAIADIIFSFHYAIFIIDIRH
jgi:hypothetical protein